ncbi:hypothetical protein GCM10007973_18280 [Polymorphobacter multimanifer]|uniref:Uncharacterized protein n=3 Tax=Polymorphobacter multimanifer TaxID=1070431 RepID=A0A841LGL9_9SPHN|nr:hypothetical protein [Polymorphobacter multimanifer]GGI82174.1 hypothetical protein GCM10007973_18280 [Polymorphobacter multimanifer]
MASDRTAPEPGMHPLMRATLVELYGEAGVRTLEASRPQDAAELERERDEIEAERFRIECERDAAAAAGEIDA